ncbi:unnamed protein product [Lampetra planeri]
MTGDAYSGALRENKAEAFMTSGETWGGTLGEEERDDGEAVTRDTGTAAGDVGRRGADIVEEAARMATAASDVEGE